MTNSKNRVQFQEDISGSVARMPFLQRFLKKDGSGLLSYELINQYMGFQYLTPDDPYTSDGINKVLEEAERRGDL